jgi:hypothetical protein
MGSGWIDPNFLTSALDGGEWSASLPGRFIPGKTPRTHCIGGCVDPKPVWTTWRKENSWTYRDSNSEISVVQPLPGRYTDYAIPNNNNNNNKYDYYDDSNGYAPLHMVFRK